MLERNRRLAIVLGVLLPVAETVRRWRQLADPRMAPAWLDDYLIGAFLLYGAWQVGKDAHRGQASLAAAYGFACGMAYAAFFIQLADITQPDPSGIPVVVVLTLKAIGIAVGAFALATTLRARPETADGRDVGRLGS